LGTAGRRFRRWRSDQTGSPTAVRIIQSERIFAQAHLHVSCCPAPNSGGHGRVRGVVDRCHPSYPTTAGTTTVQVPEQQRTLRGMGENARTTALTSEWTCCNIREAKCFVERGCKWMMGMQLSHRKQLCLPHPGYCRASPLEKKQQLSPFLFAGGLYQYNNLWKLEGRLLTVRIERHGVFLGYQTSSHLPPPLDNRGMRCGWLLSERESRSRAAFIAMQCSFKWGSNV
jgi:hypothetical protein